MVTAQLSQEKFAWCIPHPSSFHDERRFKPHTQQHLEKGSAQQADSSSRSHPATQFGPEPRAESKPVPGLDRQIHVIPMPNRGTGDKGHNGPLFDRLSVCPHQGTPFVWKALLPPGRGGPSAF